MTRDPFELTPDERRAELVELLAAALLALLGRAALPRPENQVNSEGNPLDSFARSSVTGPAG